MGATQTTAANTLATILAPGYDDAVYYNHQLLRYFRNVEQRATSKAYTWDVKAAAKTARVFTEGTAMPAAESITWTQAEVDPVYIWCPAEISGMLEDAVANGGAYFDPIAAEFVDSVKQIADLFNTSFLGSTYGLELSVDQTGAYAGVTRNGAATYFESTETNHNAALTTDALLDLHEACVDNDKGANPANMIWLVPWNQVTNIFRLAGVPGMRVFQPSDPAEAWGNSSFANGRVVGIGDMTNTTILHLDMTPENWRLVTFRKLQVKYHRSAGDSEIYKVSGGLCLINRRPKPHGKLTNVTA